MDPLSRPHRAVSPQPLRHSTPPADEPRQRWQALAAKPAPVGAGGYHVGLANSDAAWTYDRHEQWRRGGQRDQCGHRRLEMTEGTQPAVVVCAVTGTCCDVLLAPCPVGPTRRAVVRRSYPFGPRGNGFPGTRSSNCDRSCWIPCARTGLIAGGRPDTVIDSSRACATAHSIRIER